LGGRCFSRRAYSSRRENPSHKGEVIIGDRNVNSQGEGDKRKYLQETKKGEGQLLLKRGRKT